MKNLLGLLFILTRLPKHLFYQDKIKALNQHNNFKTIVTVLPSKTLYLSKKLQSKS